MNQLNKLQWLVQHLWSKILRGIARSERWILLWCQGRSICFCVKQITQSKGKGKLRKGQALLRTRWRQETYTEKRRVRGKIVSHFCCGYILKIKISKGTLPIRNSMSSYSSSAFLQCPITNRIAVLLEERSQEICSSGSENASCTFPHHRLRKYMRL